MAQQQGNKITGAGRLDGSLQRKALTSADFALGVGWGDAGVEFAVHPGSTDQRGAITITTAGANQDQATATVALTFADGAYAELVADYVPFALVQLTSNSNAITTAQPTVVVATKTGLSWVAAVLPVTAKTYTFTWAVIA